MKLVVTSLAVGVATFALLLSAAAIGYELHHSGARHDSPQARNDIAQASANVSEAVGYYDLQWDEPLHVVNVIDGGAKTNTTVTLYVAIAEAPSIGDPGNEIHHIFIVRGVFRPSGKLIGKLSNVSDHTWQGKAQTG